ncbi:uncharacterized protein LOC120494814 [Pimephales promelas]|uniref:uncharacterized protein LOC120494814 n=1 Tax=Pimephales promelas TaxID=90988 RepID=UPI001955E8FF|nr:uncharacterized protein LOC120494814 [Pimephales promelas]XP_039550083.1 uncharacterized protein LOC120494814 [Pimephales promelas]
MDPRIPVKGHHNQIFNPSEMYTNPKITIRQNTGSDQIHRHKLSSSQLLHYLRSQNPKRASDLASSADEVQHMTNITEASSRLMQQQNINAMASVDQRVVAVTSAEKHLENEVISEGKVSEPIFAEKHISVDCVAYHWMITTNSELWDTGNFFSCTNHSTAEPFPNEMVDLRFQDDWKVANLSSQRSCPSEEESCPQGSNTLTDEPEDDDGVHVQIPEFQSRKFEEIPVVVTRVVHPNKFFIQHKDANLCELSEIMLRNSSRSFAEMNSVPDVGAYVMAWLPMQEVWCRGRVLKICQLSRDIKVEVRRIDYGDDVCVSLRDVKEMSGEMASRPVQALQASLANVRPVFGETWSFEAISWFKSKVQNKTLYARIYPEGEVELFMEKGKIGAMRRGDSLSERLAQNRFAIHRSNKHKGLKRSDAQERARKRSSEWEKYLISCYH